MRNLAWQNLPSISFQSGNRTSWRCRLIYFKKCMLVKKIVGFQPQEFLRWPGEKDSWLSNLIMFVVKMPLGGGFFFFCLIFNLLEDLISVRVFFLFLDLQGESIEEFCCQWNWLLLLWRSIVRFEVFGWEYEFHEKLIFSWRWFSEEANEQTCEEQIILFFRKIILYSYREVILGNKVKKTTKFLVKTLLFIFRLRPKEKLFIFRHLSVTF